MTKDELIGGMKEASRITETNFFLLEISQLLLGFIGDKRLLKEFSKALSEQIRVKNFPEDNYPKDE